MVKHMNETEFDQIKTRIKDLAAMNAVDNAARIERVAIEEALLESPYKSHLYTEQMFDHLAFLELRELNTKLDKLLAHFAPDVTGGTCNRYCGVINTSQHNKWDNAIEAPHGEAPLKSEVPVLGDDGVGQGTTPRKSTTRKKPVKQGVI